MKIKERLITLENGIEDVKLMQSELAEKEARLQLLIKQMEQELDQYEQTLDSEDATKVNNGKLLSTHGLMKQPNKVAPKDSMPPTPPTP
ncbi:hypothetical protein OQJ19_11100 [Fluoribacter gormanii]|uniref:Uncharacterized protein n=1 Tax=Fluoribacter gormanii TaxID=464 RepID=A0A377GLI9_9GAMM|nr:hypothetical protein [Fluoribacter gormanii]KTD05046.1 hypothetical protein Lgor_0677 [Fluoribacter gormanii]MCW8442716.1 hypothetical protein [Fluoribacter gormanii]MCW8471190.1 hypothetical protein [Fluoribacter gormanii]SIR56767.1 hypothetical protein SAMN05421777_11594 [Fluoribacter gormanii]STO25676.1 Uncharacterised protein [Fluoribacter gormanii]